MEDGAVLYHLFALVSIEKDRSPMEKSRSFQVREPRARLPRQDIGIDAAGIKQRRSNNSVFERRHALKYFSRTGPIEHHVVLANFAVSKNQYPLGKLRNIVLMCNQNNS